MNARKIAGYSISFLLGIGFTLLSLYVIARIVLGSSKPIPLMENWKYNYGDLVVAGRKLSEKELPKTFTASQILSISAGTSSLVSVFQNKEGQTTLVSFNHNGQSLFDWQIHPEKPVSERTRYGGDFGEGYYDLDVDGQYDLKIYINKQGVKEKSYIYKNNIWQEVEKADFNFGRAVSGATWYQFESGKGWQEMLLDKTTNKGLGAQDN